MARILGVSLYRVKSMAVRGDIPMDTKITSLSARTLWLTRRASAEGRKGRDPPYRFDPVKVLVKAVEFPARLIPIKGRECSAEESASWAWRALCRSLSDVEPAPSGEAWLVYVLALKDKAWRQRLGGLFFRRVASGRDNGSAEDKVVGSGSRMGSVLADWDKRAAP